MPSRARPSFRRKLESPFAFRRRGQGSRVPAFAGMTGEARRRFAFASPNSLSDPQMDVSDLRVAIFSGNYNYVRDGANQALNRLADYLLRKGAAVRVYSPTVKEPAFEAKGDLVHIPALPIPGRSEYKLGLGDPAPGAPRPQGLPPQHPPRRQPRHHRPPRRDPGAQAGTCR